jgi:glycosyltransferase involved in cell wall biosynthesis
VPSLPRVSVIVPARNEAANLPFVLPLLPAGVDEVILVDGLSVDGTVEVARSIRPGIRVVAQEGCGKGAALRTGFAAARGDIVVTLDADGSADPREIPSFVAALLNGADFVKGSRFMHGGGTLDMPLYRKLGNAGFVVAVRVLFGGAYTDLCYGYNACWSWVVPLLGLDGDGFEIETMMNVRALKLGLNVVEVPSFEARRIYGRSGLRTFPDGVRVLRTILRERFAVDQRTRLPQHIPAAAGAGAAGASPAAMPLVAMRVEDPEPAVSISVAADGIPDRATVDDVAANLPPQLVAVR